MPAAYVTLDSPTADDLQVGDHLDRRLWPFTIAEVETRVGGWDGRQPLVVLTSTAGERLSLLADHRMTVPVIRAVGA